MRTYSTLPLTPNVDDLFFVVRTCSKLLTPWGSNRSQSRLFCRFSTNGISLRSGKAEMKKLQRSRQTHFLGQIALLFAPRACQSKVSLLAGYPCSKSLSLISCCALNLSERLGEA